MKIMGLASTREVFVNGRLLDPRPSQRLFNHSPTGFGWGYAGSGPAQLALALLLRAGLSHEVALRNYQTFKFEHLVALDGGRDFELEVDVRAWLLERQPVAR